MNEKKKQWWDLKKTKTHPHKQPNPFVFIHFCQTLQVSLERSAYTSTDTGGHTFATEKGQILFLKKLPALPEITLPPSSPGHLPPSSRWHRHSGRCGVSRTRGRDRVSITRTAGLRSSIPMLQGRSPASSQHTPSFKGISFHPFPKPQILK